MPLVRRNIAVTIIAHFNQIDHITGPQSQESRVRFRQDSIAALNADILWVEKQTDTAISEEMRQLEGINWDINIPL